MSETAAYKQNEEYAVKIVHDADTQSPREWDNLGTMVCFHNRYNLGDEHDYQDKDAFLFSMLEDTLGDTDLAEEKYEELGKEIDRSIHRHPNSYDHALDEKVLEVIEQKNLVLPVYMLDHSGIAISTSPFSNKWDSGVAGWAYVSHEDIAKEYGDVSTENIEKARAVIEGEIETYDQYLRGECYGFILYKNNEEINSCWGFIGDFEEAKKSIREYLPESAVQLVDEMQYGDLENLQENEESELDELEV